MKSPRQQNFFLLFSKLFTNRHHICHRLTRMVHRRFEIDNRFRRISFKRRQNRFGALQFPIFQLRKCPHTNCRNISFQNAHKLRQMLSFIRIHHNIFPMLKRPRRSAGFENHRISAKFINANLHRSPRPQRRIEKHERNRFTVQSFFDNLAVFELNSRFDNCFKFGV